MGVLGTEGLAQLPLKLLGCERSPQAAMSSGTEILCFPFGSSSLSFAPAGCSRSLLPGWLLLESSIPHSRSPALTRSCKQAHRGERPEGHVAPLL